MTKRLFFVLLLFLVILFFETLTWAQKNAKVLTPEWVVSLKQVSQVTLDASGEYVA